ncbi:MAG: alpha-hydroxy acid oxidase [Lautropia sp.]
MSIARAVTVADLRRLARRRLPRAVFDFIDGGADEELTLRANSADYDSILLEQRVLTDVGATRLDRPILGKPAAAPLLIAPTGLANMAFPDADLVLAREAAAAGIPLVASTSSGARLEDIAAVGPGRRWFQLYVFRDRAITEGLIARARAAGYEALVLTVDVPVVGRRRRDVRNGFTIPLTLTPSSLLDFALHPRWCFDIWRHGVPQMNNFAEALALSGAASHAALMNAQLDPQVDWGIVPWLRSRWDGPLLIKGVLSVADAVTAIDAGFDGIIVSNHGGRQLDGVPSTIRALARIAPAVAGRVPLLIDSGIRRGSDLVKAVALGADAVLIGRPTLYAIAAGGAAGVRHCLQILFDDLHRTLAQIGRPALAAVDRTVLLDGSVPTEGGSPAAGGSPAEGSMPAQGSVPANGSVPRTHPPATVSARPRP